MPHSVHLLANPFFPVNLPAATHSHGQTRPVPCSQVLSNGNCRPWTDSVWVLYNGPSPSVVPRPAAGESPASWLETQGPGPHTRARLSIAKVLGQFRCTSESWSHDQSEANKYHLSSSLQVQDPIRSHAKIRDAGSDPARGVESMEGMCFPLGEPFHRSWTPSPSAVQSLNTVVTKVLDGKRSLFPEKVGCI